MTKYETGVWYGWNGGKCPVHPSSTVELVLLDDTHPSRPYDPLSGREVLAIEASGVWEWAPGHRQAIAFRVVKEYREPREWWLAKGVTYTHAYEDLEGAQTYERCNRGVEIIHVREVVEGGAL